MINRDTLEDLAIFGGEPAFGEKLHVGRPNIGDRRSLLERIENVLDRRWLTNNGPYVQEFEKRLADLLGVKHCIVTCNATVALEIAIKAAELSGEVIVPSFTFVATAHALQWQEITPVFCDVESDTHNLDPSRVEELITPRTAGIIAVHLWGQPCNVDALSEIADRRGLTLMFDAAHAFGCSYRGRMIGSFGLAEVFSFHATKFFTTFEGGAVATDDDELATRIRLMRNFGFSGYDKVSRLGTNGKMHEVSAAMGLVSLESLDEFVAVNHGNYQRYTEELHGLPGVRMLEYDRSEKHNYQYIVLDVDESVAGLSRDDLVKILWAENVMARRYFYPGCHRMEPYRSYDPHAGLLLPVTESLAQRIMTLPTGTAVNPEQIRTVCDIIRTAIRRAPEIKRRVSSEIPE